MSILQLEIIDVSQFVAKYIEEIKDVLHKIKKLYSCEIIFLTCIDIEQGYNMFVTIDDENTKLLEYIINLEMDHGIGRRDGIILRKELLPLLKKYFEDKK